MVPSPKRAMPFPAFPPVVADTEAEGLVPAAIPRTANSAEVVAVFPTSKSRVLLIGESVPLAVESTQLEEPLPPVSSVPQVSTPPTVSSAVHVAKLASPKDIPVPLDPALMVRVSELSLPITVLALKVAVPFAVIPEVAVISPEIVGVAVHAVGVTVKLPPEAPRDKAFDVVAPMVKVPAVRVSSSPDAGIRILPPFVNLNLVVLLEEAAIISSVAPTLLTINPALEPMPPEMERGAGVLVLPPMLTPVSKSEVKVSSPEPAVVRVRFPFEEVVMVASPPLPMAATTPEAPKLRAVAAPAKLRVVAVVLNTLNEEESVITEVVKVGEVPNTRRPEPVSSSTDKARLALEMELANCPPVVVVTNLSGVRPLKVMVPLEEKPVKPLPTPAPVMFQVSESTTILSPLSPKFTTPFRVVVWPFATVNPPLKVASPVTARVLDREVGSDSVIDELPESITMFPVVPPPKVRVFRLRD